MHPSLQLQAQAPRCRSCYSAQGTSRHTAAKAYSQYTVKLTTDWYFRCVTERALSRVWNISSVAIGRMQDPPGTGCDGTIATQQTIHEPGPGRIALAAACTLPTYVGPDPAPAFSSKGPAADEDAIVRSHTPRELDRSRPSGWLRCFKSASKSP